MSQSDRRNCVFVICLLAALSAVYGQGGGVTWGGGNNAGAGAWSNSQQGGPGMHPPGSLGNQDPQISYGYAGVDSRGNYGGAGGNGGYYVSGTDEHGRPFSYNGGVGGQPLPGQPRYPNNYGYQSSASLSVASMGVALVLAVLVSRT
ncbi:glycine-rich cell wall structural protein 1.8 [Drosophila innubila]|uniref:glycine-rich cell wall structural protein 1.8 n=1 Tax=Drosophila innubila TaxID=198719 RepID=UPI00148E3533|nr:glycine-rich cell wall structural protein 1.8 [Drosophila innubila]